MATMGTSTSGINFSGLFSGIDTNSIVSQLITLDSSNLNNMKTQQSNIQAQENAIGSLTTQMTSLQKAADALRSASALRSTSASSSSSSVVTATTGTGAVEGTHSLVVNRLATAERMIQNNGLDASTATVGAGTFNYTYNGVTRNIQTTSSTTLQNLSDLIDNDSANPGVTASVIYDGTHYYLSLSGNKTGGANTITINDAQTTLSGFATADFTAVQQALNSQVQLDNWPATNSNTWIERDNNTISDLVPGVTFNLQTTGSSTITLTRDTSTVTNDLNNFVTAYNNMVSGLDTYTSYNSTTKKGGILQGDSIRTVLDDIKTALVTTPKGFTGSDTLTLAAQLGLAFDKTGKLSLIADSSQATTSSDGIAADVDDLADALSKNFDAALSLIGAQATGASDSNYISFVSASATSTAAGAYSVKVDYNDSGDITTARVSGDGGATWQYMTVNGNDLLMTSGPLAGLTLTSVSDGTSGAHTQTANVRVRQGFAGEVYDATKTLLDSTTGIFALEKQRFQDQYDSYTKKISDEQTRLDNEQTQLKAKYARMEATLAQISGQTAGLQSLLSSTYSTNNNSSSSSSSSGV